MKKKLAEVQLQAQSESLTALTERLAELELALEDEGWFKLGALTEMEFSREGLRRICQLARINYLKNPLIQRGVNIQVYYVFGQGMSIGAKDDAVNDVIQGFLTDAKNKAELTSHQARMYKEADLQVEGNIFFALFTDTSSGRVRVRTIPVDEVAAVITNPEDDKDPWYYKRTWSQSTLDFSTGIPKAESKTAYYPDWRHRPKAGADKPDKIGNEPVIWDTPVYHVRVGGLGRMRFGLSEVYAAIDWARAYKEFLENWSTIVKAYARFAFKITGLDSQAAMDKAKATFASTLPTGEETNPPPLTASTLLEPSNKNMEPIKTAGATTSADDGRRLLLMVCAATGTPETFFGDTSVGTLATAKSLDRPTELMMVSRQTLWADIHRDILDYVVASAIRAGELAGTVTEEDDGTPVIDLGNADPTIIVTFPPILEHDIDTVVKAIVTAGTLDGKMPAGTIDVPNLTRMLLTALGADNIDALMEELHPAGGETVAETKLIKAVVGLKEAIDANAT